MDSDNLVIDLSFCYDLHRYISLTSDCELPEDEDYIEYFLLSLCGVCHICRLGKHSSEGTVELTSEK